MIIKGLLFCTTKVTSALTLCEISLGTNINKTCLKKVSEGLQDNTVCYNRELFFCVVPSNYLKDTEPSYHSFMYSLVSLLSGFYPLPTIAGQNCLVQNIIIFCVVPSNEETSFSTPFYGLYFSCYKLHGK